MGIFGKEKTDNKPAQTNTSAPTPSVDVQGRTIRSNAMSSAALLHSEASVVKPAYIDDLPKMVNDTNFSDLYITPDKKSYIWSGKSSSGLKLGKFIDIQEFISAVEEKYDGKLSSYSLHYKGRNYRIERTIALEGEQFCARKMPIDIPDIEKLGMPSGVYRQLLSLAARSGLILFAGATGTGKSTSIAALLKKYLQTEGGYAFTIEDPIEMPLDGVYQTVNGDLGLCKQTTPPDGIWEGHLVLSTIHANNVSDAINAMAKYAASGGISEEMAYEMLANGLLGCIHQNLVGSPRKLQVETLFANPDINAGCQVRAMLRTGKLNLATIMESQKTKLERGMPLFDSYTKE